MIVKMTIKKKGIVITAFLYKLKCVDELAVSKRLKPPQPHPCKNSDSSFPWQKKIDKFSSNKSDSYAQM